MRLTQPFAAIGQMQPHRGSRGISILPCDSFVNPLNTTMPSFSMWMHWTRRTECRNASPREKVTRALTKGFELQVRDQAGTPPIAIGERGNG